MRLSSLAVAVLLVSPVLFAQHSSGGGSSGGGSSGGGSRSGGSSAGASSSSGSHGSYSGGSSAGSSLSSNHNYEGSASRSSGAGPAVQRQNEKDALQGHNGVERIHPQPEHRGFFAALRHPFRKRVPKPSEADRLRPVCKGNRCPCPPGEINGKNGRCVVVAANQFSGCPPGEYSDGGRCNPSSLFGQGDCSNLALALDRQARQSKLAESSRQASCSRDAAARECSELTAKAQATLDRYKSLQQQYEQCKGQRRAGLLAPSTIQGHPASEH